jgi:hypothetical protein
MVRQNIFGYELAAKSKLLKPDIVQKGQLIIFGISSIE